MGEKPSTNWDAHRHTQDPKWQIEALFATCARRQDHSLKMYHMCLEKPHQRHIPCRASSNLWHRQLSARPTFKKWSTENTTWVAKMWCLPAILNYIIKYPANFSVAKYFPFHTTIPRLGSYDAPASWPIPTAALMVRPYLQVNVEGVGMQLLHETAGNVFGSRLNSRTFWKEGFDGQANYSTFGTKFVPQKANTKNHQIHWVSSLDMFESFPSQVLLSSSTFIDFSWFSPNYCSKSTSLLGDLIFVGSFLDYRSLCRSPFLLVQSPAHMCHFFSYLNPHLDWFVIEKQHKPLFLLMNFP